ncbi:MAG TPA: carboxypeptidase-like regulatory domain-containing protein [Thermoanaerobaculia bacterium]|jgi:hypothetical protein
MTMLSILFGLLLAATAEPAPPAHTAAIDVTIRGTQQPLEAELLVRNEKDEWDEIAHKHVPASTRQVGFDKLAPGVYQLLLRGRAQTEQLGTKIVLGSLPQKRTITIEPVEVTGRVTLGDVPVGAGAFFLRHQEFSWRGGVELKPDGTFRAPLWQTGSFTANVRAASLPTAYVEVVKLEKAPFRLDVRIPDGRITGVIRDAKSGAPVGGALVMLQSTFEEGERNLRATTNAEGAFEFSGVRDAKHVVTVTQPEYLQPAAIAFTFGGSTRFKQLAIGLETGRRIPVVAIDAENDAVANATVLAVAGGRVCSRAKTDDDGRVIVAVPEQEAATIYVIPEGGSFAMLRVTRNDPAGVRKRIDLPRAASSLQIVARTTDGGAMPPFALLVRYNGELIPREVAEELTVAQGLKFGAGGSDSGAQMPNIPSGAYEFWPYRTGDEADAILASGAAFAAPIQVNVRTGENKIAVKFAAR